MPMHIVHLETGRHLYGGARQVLMLLEGLADAGVQSSLVCAADSAIATAANTSRVNVVPMPMKGDLDVLFPRRLNRWLNDVKPDLLHVHSRRGADLWGGLAARPTGLKTVLTRRVDNPEPPVLGLVKYGMYDRIIAISAAIQEQLVADGAAAVKLRVVRSAVAVADCQPTWERSQFLEAFDCEPDALTVACVAQFIPRKGHTDLLKAWVSVVREHPRARLLLFGQGPLDDEVRAQIQATGLDSSVRVVGFRDDLRSFLGCADLLAHSARREGLGICLLEAQAAGVPVVANGVGGIPEVFGQGRGGMLIEPGRPDKFAAAVNRLLADADLRNLMGQQGAAYVAEHFSPQAMVSGNLSVYKEILE
jgi:glycosyltransferase involved in cell wall biosynthesis